MYTSNYCSARAISMLIPLILLHTLFSEAQNSSSWPIQNSGYTDVVQWDHYSWIVNGERIFIFGGEMHPFRLPVPEMWEDIMQKMKAGGMNTLSFYSHWGFHEDIEGKLDLKTGARDLSRLLGYARDAGLFVSVRPGPYINGELSAGGFPLWLTTGAFGSLRNNDTRYTAAWMPYHTAIADLVAPYQINQHGTVISYQIENEYPNQWSSQSSKTPKATAVAYFKALEAVVRAQGIDVPTTHNAPGTYASWSKDFDTVGAGGDVDIWGYDTYPLCWSCVPSDCSAAHAEFTLLEYYTYFQYVAPNQPSYMPEFQGGRVNPLDGPIGGCADTVGVEFRNLYYRHNIDQKVTSMMLYMVYGGTSWGWLGVPFIGTSYDYSAPIAEDRTLRDSWYESKTFGLFTRVAVDLRKVDRIGNGTFYTDNSAITATELRNPDTDAAFYVVRHTTSTEDSEQKFRLNVSTSEGIFKIPQSSNSMVLSGHVANIVVTDFSVGYASLIYSTAEIMTFIITDGNPTVVLWVPTGGSGEFYVKNSTNIGKITRCDACSEVNFTRKVDGSIASFTQGTGVTFLRFDDLRVILVDRPTAWRLFAPSLTADLHSPPNESIIVTGPYLVRTASILSDILYLTGDTNETTTLEVVVPRIVAQVSWNGELISTAPTSWGTRKGSLPGPITYQLPKLSGWKTKDSFPERWKNYSDTGLAWVHANHTTTASSSTSATKPYLFIDEYGFHTGIHIWRGSFVSHADGAYIKVQGGVGFAFSAYLNGLFLDTFPGSASSASSGMTITFDNATLNENNTLVIIQDNTGHDEGSGATTVRGILNATLLGTTKTFDSWKVAGTAGGSINATLDPVRGIYNEGGLTGERLGWHLPGYDDSSWQQNLPSTGISDAGVQFYRTTIDLDVPDGHDMSVSFILTQDFTSNVRAFLYVNGYQYGRYMPSVSSTNTFPVPPGILNYGGRNVIALALWSLNPSGANIRVDWEMTKLTRSSLNTKFDASYLQPSWSSDRTHYA